jgi:hypothetical protein
VRPILEIAERFLRERASWRKCCDEGVENTMRAAAMAALAWVLEVDLELMTAPKVEKLSDPPDTVRLTRVESLNAWLVEFPPCREPEYTSAYWAAFLSHTQLLELMRAGMLALVPGAIPSPDAESRAIEPVLLRPRARWTPETDGDMPGGAA